MKLARCEKGHYYDREKFTTCPHCANQQVAPDETVAFDTEPVAPGTPKVEIAKHVPLTMNASAQTEKQSEMTTIMLDPEEALVKPMKEEQVPIHHEEPKVEVPEPIIEEPKIEVSKPKIEVSEPIIETPEPPKAKAAVPVTPTPVQSAIQEEDMVTMSFEQNEPEDKIEEKEPIEIDTNRPDTKDLRNEQCVIGWLVALKGNHTGESFPIKMGRNFIGKSPSMDIQLTKSETITAYKHAILTYDPKTKNCFLQAGETRDLIYVNGDVLLTPIAIKHDDLITMGDDEFIFFEFLCEHASWLA